MGYNTILPWRRHQMETFSTLLTLWEGIHRSPVDSPHKGLWCGAFIFPLTCCLSKQLNKPSHKREGHCRLEKAWWHHQIETFSALLAICAGYSPVTGEFPAQRPVMRSFDVFFDRRPNKRLSKQWWSWWFETPSYPLWRHGSVYKSYYIHYDKNWKWILSAKDKNNYYVDNTDNLHYINDRCFHRYVWKLATAQLLPEWKLYALHSSSLLVN